MRYRGDWGPTPNRLQSSKEKNYSSNRIAALLRNHCCSSADTIPHRFRDRECGSGVSSRLTPRTPDQHVRPPFQLTWKTGDRQIGFGRSHGSEFRFERSPLQSRLSEHWRKVLASAQLSGLRGSPRYDQCVESVPVKEKFQGRTGLGTHYNFSPSYVATTIRANKPSFGFVN